MRCVTADVIHDVTADANYFWNCVDDNGEEFVSLLSLQDSPLDDGAVGSESVTASRSRKS